MDTIKAWIDAIWFVAIVLLYICIWCEISGIAAICWDILHVLIVAHIIVEMYRE